MEPELRKSGISVIGNVPWGTHFCHFYETKQDLLDTVIPYFKAGLESNEFCLWVVSHSDLITVEEAKGALAEAVPDLDRHLSEENIEILNGRDWYLEKNKLNLDRVTSGWTGKLKRAQARGYDGLRVSGDTFWLAQKDWKDFRGYEKQLNETISQHRMTILCTYSLAKSRASEILDVLDVHQFATALRQGDWQVIQSPELTQAKSEIKRLNEELQRIVRKTTQPPLILRYVVPILAVTAALIINQLLNINLVGAPAMLFLCALMFSAWYGGVKPSLLALPLAVIAFAYYFVTPINSWTVDVREIPRLLLFVLSSLFVISLSGAQKRAAESLRQARDVLAGTVEELKRTNQALRTENTERRIADEELKKEKEILEKIFDNIPVMIGFVGDDGVKLVNLEWERTIGWTLKELQEQNVDIFVEAYPDPSYRQEVLDFVAASTGEWVDLKIKVRDGRVIDAACAVVHLSDGTRVAIAQDITERKQAENALRRSEDQLRLVIDTMPTIAWTVQPDGTVDFVNQRWLDFAGMTWDEYVKDVNAVVHPEDKTTVIANWLAAIEAAEPYEAEMRVRRADGEYRWFLVRIEPLRDESGRIIKWYGVSTDIHDRKRAEEQVKATSEQLRALSASLQSAREQESTRIAREIHDELGGALTSLRWDLEGMGDVVSEPMDSKQLPGLQKRIETMVSLTETTLDTVRRLASELRPVALDELGLVEAIEWQAQQFQTRTGITVRFQCSLEKVDLDRKQSTEVFRILQEALTNVLRHAQATEVTITIRQEASEFLLTIADNGRGITETEKLNLHSLGLLGMRERANLIGARIEISGSEGKGTVVALRIPIGKSTRIAQRD